VCEQLVSEQAKLKKKLPNLKTRFRYDAVGCFHPTVNDAKRNKQKNIIFSKKTGGMFEKC